MTTRGPHPPDWMERLETYRISVRGRAASYAVDPDSAWSDYDSEQASFLDYFGTPEEIEARLQAVQTLLRSLERTGLEGGRLADAYEVLEHLGRDLQELQETAIIVTDSLGDRGWRFDPLKRKVIALPGAANRPVELLPDEIRSICRAWNVTSNLQEVREEIANALAHLFPPDQLDPRPGGPIENAINNWLRTNRPPESTLAQTGDGLDL